MGKYTDIVTKFETLLTAAKVTGQTLAYMSKVDFDLKEVIFKDLEVPFLVATLGNGIIQPNDNRSNTADFIITVQIKNRKQNGNNIYLKSGAGIAVDFENVINVIRADLDFGSTAQLMGDPDWFFEPTGDFIVCTINFPFVSRSFEPGDF